jgi:hypothetical protein
LSFLVTVNVGDTRESVREVRTREDLLDFIDSALTLPHHVPNGGIIQIRRADYLDAKPKDGVVSGTTTGRTFGHLTVYDGGRS